MVLQWTSRPHCRRRFQPGNRTKSRLNLFHVLIDRTQRLERSKSARVGNNIVHFEYRPLDMWWDMPDRLKTRDCFMQT